MEGVTTQINVFVSISQCYNFAILVLEKSCHCHGHENNQDKGFWRTWTKHDEKENLVLSPNLQHKHQGQKHETCVQNVC